MSPLANLTAETLAPLWSRHDVPTARIAARLGVTDSGLRYKARALGLPPRPMAGTVMQKCSNDLFRRMWEAGVNTTEIAEMAGYAYSSCVSTRARKMGLARRHRAPVATDRNCVGGWAGTITMAAFREIEAARRMGVTVAPDDGSLAMHIRDRREHLVGLIRRGTTRYGDLVQAKGGLRRAVYKDLVALMAAGRVVRVRRGRYAVAGGTA